MELVEILDRIVADDARHAKWLNTLSMMENSGARKIKGCEHPVLVSEVILKHASEEARHAYYLKKQIAKVDANACPTYEQAYLIAPARSQYYLDQLDIDVCKWLKSVFGFKGHDLKYAAYLLVTYAIEVRAESLYPIYKSVLEKYGSKVKVNTIIAEEEGHLEEMRKQIAGLFQDPDAVMSEAEKLENRLYEDWVIALNEHL